MEQTVNIFIVLFLIIYQKLLKNASRSTFYYETSCSNGHFLTIDVDQKEPSVEQNVQKNSFVTYSIYQQDTTENCEES